MKPTVLAIASFLALTGCATSELISSKAPSRSAYAPVNELDYTGGTVKYNLGNPSHSQRGREDAYKRMHDYCHGPYRIVNESIHAENSDGMLLNGVLMTETSQFNYIDFHCGQS